MNITKVSVTWGEKKSLPKYCNVKPSITIEATFDGDFIYPDSIRHMTNLAQHSVQELVDEALEDAGRPAKYSTEERFKVRQSRDRMCIVIVPNVLMSDALPSDFYNVAFIPDGLRYKHLTEMITKYRPIKGAQIIDCSDCDLTRIPPHSPSDPPKIETKQAPWFETEEDDEGEKHT